MADSSLSPLSPAAPTGPLPSSPHHSSSSSSTDRLSIPPLPLPAAPTTVTPRSRHCSHLILSEFDILKGSQVGHQYPSPTSIKESFLAEAMLPEGAHLRESDWTIFFLSKSQIEGKENEIKGEDDELYSVINLVRTKYDKTVKRGAIVKALAVITRYRWYNLLKPLLLLALDSYLDCRDDEDAKRLSILANLYNTINSLDLSSLPPLSLSEKAVIRSMRLRGTSPHVLGGGVVSEPISARGQGGGGAILGPDHIITNVKWNNTPIPLRIPVFLEDDEVMEASLTFLISRFGEGVMMIYNAILSEKRVLFLGYQQPSVDVCTFVLSALLLISPPLTGTLSRAFPYANLTNLHFLSVSGYIAGVTNPIFESRKEWFDVLANITNGELIISPQYAEELNSNPEKEKQNTMDASFYQELTNGIRLRYGEEWVRSMFRDYTTFLLTLSSDSEKEKTFLGDIRDRTLQWHCQANHQRLNLLQKSKIYQDWEKKEKKRIEKDSAFKEKDGIIRYYVRALQRKTDFNANEITMIFNDLTDAIQKREEVLEFLSLLPESLGGLTPIALALFHRITKIRQCALLIMSRIDKEPEGQKAISSLNYFLLMTYYRHSRAVANEKNNFLDDPMNTSFNENDEDAKEARRITLSTGNNAPSNAPSTDHLPSSFPPHAFSISPNGPSPRSTSPLAPPDSPASTPSLASLGPRFHSQTDSISLPLDLPPISESPQK